MKMRIESTDVKVKEGTSAKSGKPYKIREQEALATFGRETRVVKVPLRDDQEPYTKGEYALDDSSFYVGRFGDLQVRPVLVPVKGRAAA